MARCDLRQSFPVPKTLVARGKVEATRAGATSGEATWVGAEATVRLGQLVLRLRRRPRLHGHGAEAATGSDRFELNFMSMSNKSQAVKLSNCQIVSLVI